MELRPMTMTDADKMLEWKNLPETRQFAIATHDEVKREDHLAWLEKNIDQFQVILQEKFMGDFAVAGAVRINGLEVSIWVDREWRGEGLALETLNQVSFTGMIARIVDGNIPSMRTFGKAGFIARAHKDNYYILEKP